MHIEPTLLNPACQTLESVGITVSSEGFALGPIFFAFSSSSQTLKHLVTKWRVTCFLGVTVLCTSYIEICRKHLCLTTAFYRDRLQYLHLLEASACLLIKQQELWLRVELLDWQFYFYSWALLSSPEVFWFSLSENRKSWQLLFRNRPERGPAHSTHPNPGTLNSLLQNFCQAVCSHWDPLTKLQY